MQSMGTLFQQSLFDGQFSVVDAADSSGRWATYITGTAMSGGYHYAVRLDSSGKPVALAWDDQSSGASPVGQAPLIVRQGSTALAVYAYTSGTKTTLVERPFTGGIASTATLPLTLSSTISYDPASGTAFLGDTAGNLWQMQISGDASVDAKAAAKVGATTDGSAALYTGLGTYGSTEYAWAASKQSLTVFALGGQGWAPAWATSTAGSVSPVQALPTGATIEGAPVLTGDVLSVPVYGAPTSSDTCGPGTSLLMFFSLQTGVFPSGQVHYAFNSQALTGSLVLPAGTPFSPSVTSINQTISLLPGSSGELYPGTPLQISSAPMSRLVQWKEMF
jgi:hypothetical protein